MTSKSEPIFFGKSPVVPSPVPACEGSIHPHECEEHADSLSSVCALPRAADVSFRVDQSGKPSNGSPSEFDNVFSMTDESGVRYDFREGLRVMIPARMEGSYEVTGMDSSNGFIHFDVVLKAGGSVFSRKKWYIPWRVIVRKGDQVVMDRTMSLEGAEVAIHFPRAGIGDTIAWFSYAEAFEKRHGCRLTCCMDPRMAALFKPCYPSFKWEDEDVWRTTPYYAVYHMGIFCPDNENDRQPVDFRIIGLHHAAASILGLPFTETPPRVAGERKQGGRPYVCISVRASSRCKEWLNPYGWPSLVRWLMSKGYDVVDVDRDYVGNEGTIPPGVMDATGDLPLEERASLIKGASAFIGVSSGMSWLAWCCGVPVVLISGWTLPVTEFFTPYRVINMSVCHGCWNDMREEFDHYDGMYCPRHKGTQRQHECSRAISADQVIRVMETIPGFSKEVR